VSQKELETKLQELCQYYRNLSENMLKNIHTVSNTHLAKVLSMVAVNIEDVLEEVKEKQLDATGEVVSQEEINDMTDEELAEYIKNG